jgi:hypothetical protein
MVDMLRPWSTFRLMSNIDTVLELGTSTVLENGGVSTTTLRQRSGMSRENGDVRCV